MKLYINPLERTSIGTNDKGFNIKIENNGTVIYNAVPTNPVSTSAVIYDNNGLAMTASLYTTVDYKLYIDIPFYNSWDSVDLKITISYANFNSYTQTFRLYSIDTELPIELISDANLTSLPAHTASVIIYKPFSNKGFIYRICNSMVDSVGYYTSSNQSLSNNANFEMCITEDDTLNVIVTENNTSNTFTLEVLKYTYFPSFDFSYSCQSNCGECLTTLSDNDLEVIIDTSLLSHLTIDGSVELDGLIDWYVVTAELINQNGAIALSENTSGTVVDLETFTFDSFNFTTDDVYIIKACYSIYGNFPILSSGSVDVGVYLILNDDFDISNLTYTGTTSNFQIIEVTVGGIPVDWGTGRLIPIFNTNNIGDSTTGYYKVLDNDGVTINGDTVVVGQIIPYTEDIDILAIAGTGYIVEVSEVYTCCKTEAIEPCELYEVEQVSCAGYNVTNRSLSNISFIVYRLDSSKNQTWIQTEEETTLSSLSEALVSFTTDGVYKIDLKVGSDTYTKIIINSCNLETCNLSYLNTILCCNPDTNCTDKKDSNCIDLNFYNFNAFSILLNTFYSLVNYNYDITESFTVITDEKLNTLYEINDILTRAYEYCNDCKECDEV